MRITELFTAQSIALDEALQTQEQILSRLVELQATHGNITDREAYKKALYAREAEGSTYVDNGITVPHAKTNVVTRPSLAALRLTTPVQYNAEDDGTTDLLFAIAAPENGSLHVDMLARMMQMLMNEDFVEKLKAAKSPKEFLECIDAQEEAQFGTESFTQQAIPQDGYRILAVTACVNGIAHTYMAAEALTKAGDKLGLPTKVETNGSDGAKNILTRAEIAACDGIIVAAEKKVDTARFDGKPVLFTRVDDGIHKPEELIKKIVHGEVPVYHAEGGAQAAEDASGKDSFGRTLYKNLMNGVSHMLPFVVGGGIMIALAFLLDDYSIDPSNFGMNTPLAAFFKTVGSAAFSYMLPILAGFIAMSIADRPGLAVGFAGGVLAMELHTLFNYGDVPWTMMAQVGVLGRMRGYYEGRYRDRNIMEGQLELRQHIKGRNGIAVWVGLANVFPNFGHIYYDEMLPNYGIGYRWEFKKRVNIRFDLGFTKDSPNFTFNINEAF